MEANILLIEDDLDICDLVTIYLRRMGYRVDVATSAEQGLELLNRSTYHLLLSDIMLPGMDGLQLAETVRSESNVPIIFMTCKKDSQDIIDGLRIGGDDYITKPFDPDVLVARVQVGLRRYEASSGIDQRSDEWIWEDHRLKIDKRKLLVSVDNVPVTFSAKELQLLLHLAKHPEQIFSVSSLYETIWGLHGQSDDRTVMVHIHNLRKKIEKDAANPRYIVTVRGFGYKFTGTSKQK